MGAVQPGGPGGGRPGEPDPGRGGRLGRTDCSLPGYALRGNADRSRRNVMSHRYDAIVVGARCAGAATAMLLARRGFDVLLVDRARFPSEIPHGHYVRMRGPPRLAAWGLLDRVLATGCPPI